MKLYNVQICEVSLDNIHGIHTYTLVKTFPNGKLSVWKDDVEKLDIPPDDCIGFITALVEQGGNMNVEL